MRTIEVNLNQIQDDEMETMYDLFGLGVKEKSYKDFELRMLQIQLDTIVKVYHRQENAKKCPKWIFVLEDMQQKSEHLYVIWGV